MVANKKGGELVCCMNLEQTYKTVVIKEMLEAELRELENIQEKLNRDKTVSKAAIRKLVKERSSGCPSS